MLPNPWDLASARLLVESGFPAIGTTSLGIAAARGLADGTRASRDATIGFARELVDARLGCYVSVDIEDGFSDDPRSVGELVAALDVDGVNIEDSIRGELVDPRLAAQKIAAVREADPSVFINARTDVFWLGGTDLEAAVERLRIYAAAGADSVFLPGTADPHAMETVAARIELPLNVLATPTLSPSQLGELGVARISTGSLLYRVSLDQALQVALAVRDGQSYRAPVDYERVQRLARSGESIDESRSGR